jgi:hypothetical protein
MYFASRDLAQDGGDKKDGDKPIIKMGRHTGEKHERNRDMDVKEPLEGVLFRPGPEIAKGKIEKESKDEKP